MGDFPRAARVREAEPADAGGPRHKSVFHITINSNRKPATRNAEAAMRDNLRNYIQNTFSSNEFLEEMVMFQEGTGSWSDAHIDEVDVDFAIEKGAKKGRIHTHIVLEVVHRSIIRLDPKAIVDSVSRELGYRPYVHITGKGDRTFNLREYNRKQQERRDGGRTQVTAPHSINAMFSNK